jgi:hypothetical protein
MPTNPQITPGSGYVASAHIYTGVHAYNSAQHLISVVYQNAILGSTDFGVSEFVDAIKNGERFAIV